MKSIKECEKLSKPKLLTEIHNRQKLMEISGVKKKLLDEIAELWKMLERRK